MQKIKESFKKIKDDVYTLHTSNKGEDLDRIMNIKELSEETKKELILLISNLKEEIRDLKNFQLITLAKLADGGSDMADRVDELCTSVKERAAMQDEKVKIIEDKQNSGFWSVIMSSTLYKTIVGAMAFIIFLVILHAINPNSTAWAGDLVKNMFSSSKSIAEGGN